MIDLSSDTVTDRESMMSNHRRMTSRTFNDFSLRCTRELQMFALTVTVIWCKLPSAPFLACHSAVVIAGSLNLSNRSVARVSVAKCFV